MVRQIIRMCSAILFIVLTLPIVQADGLRLSMARLPDSQHSTAAAQAILRTCRVTSIHDGDSMRVRCPGFKKTLPIRLDQIDAPELEQAYGVKSRDFLRSMCPIGKKVIIHDMGPDTYNRHLGRIFCNDVDVSAAMVKSGAAWIYDYYATDKSLYPLQDAARSQKRGLWAAKNSPVAPWDFRYQQRRQRSP